MARGETFEESAAAEQPRGEVSIPGPLLVAFAVIGLGLAAALATLLGKIH